MNLTHALLLVGSGILIGLAVSIHRVRRAQAIVEQMRRESRALIARNSELRIEKGQLNQALDRAHAELQRRCDASTPIEAYVKNNWN